MLKNVSLGIKLHLNTILNLLWLIKKYENSREATKHKLFKTEQINDSQKVPSLENIFQSHYSLSAFILIIEYKVWLTNNSPHLLLA